jgi:hypothetical protein
MPKATGEPIGVVPGPFMDTKVAAASWVVVANKQYSLCYFTLGATKRTVCRPIKAPVVRGTRISVRTISGMQVLSVSLPREAVGDDRKSQDKNRQSLLAFQRALFAAQSVSTKNAMKRYSGKLMPMPNEEILPGSGGCDYDDWGSYCDGGGNDGGNDGGGGGDWPDGGGDYWPDDGGSDWWPDDDPSGGYPDWPVGGDQGQPEPDSAPTGDNEPTAGTAPWPILPGNGPNNAGGWDSCIVTPFGLVCTSSGRRPDPLADPTEPPLPSGPPPSEPSNDPWWCGIPLIGRFICGEPLPPPRNPPPSDPGSGEAPEQALPEPTAPADGRPLTRYKEGYEQAREQCDADRETDEKRCQLSYILHGGPVYEDKIEQGEKLTAVERKWFKDAKKEYSACKTKAGTAWGTCIKQAMDDYRETDPLKAGEQK